MLAPGPGARLPALSPPAPGPRSVITGPVSTLPANENRLFLAPKAPRRSATDRVGKADN